MIMVKIGTEEKIYQIGMYSCPEHKLDMSGMCKLGIFERGRKKILLLARMQILFCRPEYISDMSAVGLPDYFAMSFSFYQIMKIKMQIS